MYHIEWDYTCGEFGVYDSDGKLIKHGKNLAHTERLLSEIQQVRPTQRPPDVMPCGHPQSAVVQADEGTAYCSLCEESAQRR
jgi:hypothetical protein